MLQHRNGQTHGTRVCILGTFKMQTSIIGKVHTNCLPVGRLKMELIEKLIEQGAPMQTPLSGLFMKLNCLHEGTYVSMLGFSITS